MLKLFQKTLLILTVAFLFNIFSGVGLAQDSGPQSPNQNVAPPSAPDAANDVGFDWRWLLPLLAIPVLFYAFRDRSLSDYPDHERLAGYKGGRTRHNDHEPRHKELGEEDDDEE